MKKLFLSLVIALSFAAYACPALAQIPDIGSAFIRGMEAARRANWEDRQNYYTQLINESLLAYQATGNFDYLCIAAVNGSEVAQRHLFKHDMRCVIE
ncbi:MAG: hypothetical protein LBF38_08840 [Deltaproteobacteria bacterium]|jgi:hypothetical protein|nr:hypothetical protein [Deltaproteobacteria bacterium]